MPPAPPSVSVWGPVLVSPLIIHLSQFGGNLTPPRASGGGALLKVRRTEQEFEKGEVKTQVVLRTDIYQETVETDNPRSEGMWREGKQNRGGT